MIENVSFGRIEIDGRTYTSDVIVYPDGRVEDEWWRKRGHGLCFDDIARLIETGPDIIVAGTGDSGGMKPEAGLKEDLEKKGIEFIAKQNDKAYKVYNDLLSEKKVGACFHLTC